MKNIKYLIIFFSLVLFFSSCENENYEFGDIVAPTNLAITYKIVGKDATHPYGDGSGTVNFTAKADNTMTYLYNFAETKTDLSTTGASSNRFTKVGVNTYTITVIASGKGGAQTSSSVSIDVYSSFEDPEAKNFLSGGAGKSKKWYWAADKPVNIGLGPNTVQADNSHTFPAWFTSTAWHSDKLCMYDAEFVFTQSADGQTLSLEQLKEIAYLPGDYATTIGVAGNTCHGASVVPSLKGLKTVSLGPSNSIATLAGVNPTYRGTTINVAGDGFMCWYVGKSSSNLEIITITNTTLKVRVEEGPRAWYCYFQTEKPIK